MNGRALAEHLRKAYPGIRIIYTSGYTDDALLRHGAMLESESFLEKPFQIRALLRKIRESLS